MTPFRDFTSYLTNVRFPRQMFIKDYTEEDRFLNLFDSLFNYAYLHWKMIPHSVVVSFA